MEFWEGVILVVGGIWLVGRMSRKSGSHPANATVSQAATLAGTGNTQTTNTAGQTALVAGENLAPVAPMMVTPKTLVANPVASNIPVLNSKTIYRLPVRSVA